MRKQGFNKQQILVLALLRKQVFNKQQIRKIADKPKCGIENVDHIFLPFIKVCISQQVTIYIFLRIDRVFLLIIDYIIFFGLIENSYCKDCHQANHQLRRVPKTRKRCFRGYNSRRDKVGGHQS